MTTIFYGKSLLWTNLKHGHNYLLMRLHHKVKWQSNHNNKRRKNHLSKMWAFGLSSKWFFMGIKTKWILLLIFMNCFVQTAHWTLRDMEEMSKVEKIDSIHSGNLVYKRFVVFFSVVGTMLCRTQTTRIFSFRMQSQMKSNTSLLRLMLFEQGGIVYFGLLAVAIHQHLIIKSFPTPFNGS